MYIDTTTYLNSFAGSSGTSETSSELGKDAFLNLFVAQLENQDPLNPMEDTETIAQLAQFSSLEQLGNIASSLEDMTALVTAQQSNSAVSYLGTKVLAAGNEVALEDGEATKVTYSVPEDATDVAAHVYDENGYIVASFEIGDRDEGEYDFTWDGTDGLGNTVPDGIYSIAFSAESAEGEMLTVTPLIEGVVTGFRTESSGIVFELDDGRSVSMSNVYKVIQNESESEAA